MTQPKCGKLISNNKDTRWDRIRKRNSSNHLTNLKSDAVKKFIEIDYIGRHQQKMLNSGTKSEGNLDPVLVMNMRHEMFKKIPRKLPLATMAYSKNLQQCKSHNVAVEDHYIENQLKQFRRHLQKQHEQNKLSLKKINPLLIDNTNIINSLETAHQHIEDFYKAPMEALQQVQNLLAVELEKHAKIVDEQNIDLDDGNLVDSAYLNEAEENTNLFVLPGDVKSELEGNEFNSVTARSGELNVNNEICNSIYQMKEVGQRTPSPLENTDEVLKPLRRLIEDPSVIHLKYVRFDDERNGDHLKRESSTCSNTSDGIDSVISDLAEEALRELQMQEHIEVTETLKNLPTKFDNECSHESENQNKNTLMITGEVVLQEPIAVKEHKIKSLEQAEDNVCFESEQLKIINDLFQKPDCNKTSILRKYFSKWIHYTTIEKIEREHVDIRADRVKKINIFLNRIRMEKKRLKNRPNEKNDEDFSKRSKSKETMENIKINKKYQNKIKVQQDIIDLQRLKLERQERMIMELKLHKLSEESKEARQELKNELKSFIRSGDPKSKAKAKCLQLIGNLKDKEEDDFNKLQGRSLLVPTFLQNMQERALERDIRHQQAKQRRQQQEAEREAQKLALEEAKRLEDEEAKRLRIEVLKEKRRQEKMAKIIKERERQKYIENLRKAQDFYKRLLLKRIGLEGFKRLLQRKACNLRKCEELRQSLYKKTYFQAWFSLYRINKARRNKKADAFYEKYLKRKYLQLWLEYIYEERNKFNVAVDYSELKIIENMFQKWKAYAERMQLIGETKMRQAISHHEWHLKWKVLDCWQRLPQILQLEKETEQRRQRWRLKIWELLPDYKPNRDEFNYV